MKASILLTSAVIFNLSVFAIEVPRITFGKTKVSKVSPVDGSLRVIDPEKLVEEAQRLNEAFRENAKAVAESQRTAGVVVKFNLPSVTTLSGLKAILASATVSEGSAKTPHDAGKKLSGRNADTKSLPQVVLGQADTLVSVLKARGIDSASIRENILWMAEEEVKRTADERAKTPGKNASSNSDTEIAFNTVVGAQRFAQQVENLRQILEEIQPGLADSLLRDTLTYGRTLKTIEMATKLLQDLEAAKTGGDVGKIANAEKSVSGWANLSGVYLGAFNTKLGSLTKEWMTKTGSAVEPSGSKLRKMMEIAHETADLETLKFAETTLKGQKLSDIEIKKTMDDLACCTGRKPCPIT